MVMQKPGDRAMPLSMPFQSSSLTSPAQRSAQILPKIGAAAERLAVPVAAQHRTRGQEDRRQIHADGAHQQAGSCLVAAAHQDRAVDRQAAQRFFGIHRQQIPVEHRTGLHVGLGDGERRNLHGKAARLPHSTLDRLRAFAQVGMAGIDFAPGVHDRDHRLAGEVFPPVAKLQHARTMAEAAHRIRAEPAVAA